MGNSVQTRAKLEAWDRISDDFQRTLIASHIPGVNDYNLWSLTTKLDRADAVAQLRVMAEQHVGNNYWIIDPGYKQGDVYLLKCHYTVCPPMSA